jgi:hypothetical protein
MEETTNEVVTPVTVKQPVGFYLTWQKALVGFIVLLVVFGVGMLGGMVSNRQFYRGMMFNNQPGQYQQYQDGNFNNRQGMMGRNGQPTFNNRSGGPGQNSQGTNNDNYCPRLQTPEQPTTPSTNQ